MTDPASGKHGSQPAASAPAEDIAALKEKAAKAGEYWEKILRLSADFENTKKRLQKQSEENVRYANEKLVQEIFPVVDDLDRAIASLDEGHDLKKVKDGLHLVQSHFHRVLERNGIEIVTSKGEVFDPHRHEAVAEVATDEIEEGRVVEEVRKGYLLNGRLVRPSRVKIAKKNSE